MLRVYWQNHSRPAVQVPKIERCKKCAALANESVAGFAFIAEDSRVAPRSSRRAPTSTPLMRVADDLRVPEDADADRVANLAARIARIEAHLGFTVAASPAHTAALPPAVLAPVFARRTTQRDEFEFELGQHWFALGGVGLLTAGLAFLISMPYAGHSAVVPAGIGFCLAAGLLGVSHIFRRAFPGGPSSLRAAAMSLFGFSALRLFYFSPNPAMDADSPLTPGVLIGVAAINVAVGWRQHSPWLMALALTICSALALAAGTAPLTLASIVAVAMIALAVSQRESWPALFLVGLALAHLTYFVWSMGNPFRTGSVHFIAEPTVAPLVLLGLVALLGSVPLFRPRDSEDVRTDIITFVNCALGYGAFLVHTAAVFPTRFAVLHLAAAVVLLTLAIAFCVRVQSRVSTFFYAMTGYAALTLAILKLSSAPNVFIWLSAQSVLVVATAIWFRSRFIIVANFFIFAAIVASYMAVTRQESGISVGFGLVAIATARILKWQQHRLELTTELMRNVYLASAFVIFPYAGYHLVPVRYVALVWIAVAGAYYGVNAAVGSRKYRWMGHGTLILATLYVIGMGVSRFEPVYRVLSFLVLGTTLLTVSILFSRARRRQTPFNPVKATLAPRSRE